MGELIASGRMVEWIVVLMVIEAVVLVVLNRKLRRGISPVELILKLGAGAALLLALRSALMHATWPAIAAWLLVSLGAHIGELTLRWSAARA